MDDKEVTAGLALLAEEADPAPIDVDAVINAAKARDRHRKASIATAFATVALIGTLAGTLGGDNGTSPTDGSEQPPTTSPENPPTLEYVQDERSAELTDQLAEAWPSIKPAGVTAESSPWYPGQEPLEFVGQRYGTVAGYMATARLVDGEGGSNFVIDVSAPDDLREPSPFKPCAPASGCAYEELSDGTRVNTLVVDGTAGGMGVETSIEVLRPDGLRFRVMEHNSFPEEVSPDSRPTPVFSVEGLLKFATVFSY